MRVSNMSDVNTEKLREIIKNKGIEAIKTDPKSVFKEIGVELTDLQARGITKQLEKIQTNMEEQILGLLILLK